MNKDIKLKQPTIPTNKVLEGTENYLNYYLLSVYFLILIMTIIGIFKNDSELLFPAVFALGGVAVAVNIYSFNAIHKKLKKAKANCEITQLTSIIDLEPQNSDAYYLRGQAKKEIKEYLSALRDFSEAHRLESNLSDYLKQALGDDIKYCKEKVKTHNKPNHLTFFRRFTAPKGR